RKAIMDVQASCDELAGIIVPDASRERADPPAAVLERAAIYAGSRPRCQQLVEQVTVALLEIDEVEADPVGQTTHAQRRAQRSQVVLKLHLQPESPGVVP